MPHRSPAPQPHPCRYQPATDGTIVLCAVAEEEKAAAELEKAKAEKKKANRKAKKKRNKANKKAKEVSEAGYGNATD